MRIEKMLTKSAVIFTSMLVFILADCLPVSACFTVVVGKNASATGEVLMGHNEDQGGRLAMQQHIVPRANHPAGEVIYLEKGKAAVPQAEQTWRYMWSEARGAAPGISFCDFFINEWGVAVVSDNCGPSKEQNPSLTDGGLGYGLRKIIAERARTAREGVEIAAGLIQKYGYFPSGRSYQIADNKEGWLLQIVSGNHYVAKRVGDNEVALIPNHYTIRSVDLNDTANYIASPDLINYAIDQGWYTPKIVGDNSDFDFAKAYQAPEGYAQPYNVLRHKHAIDIINGGDFQGELPFAITPAQKVTIDDVKRVLRSHYEGTGDDLTNGYQTTPHYTKNRVICTSTTVESSVIQFRDNPDFTVVWRTAGHPCTNAYMPWYLGITKVPQGFEWMSPEVATKTHFSPSPDDYSFESARAWWTFQGLQSLADPQYGSVVKQLKQTWNKLENKWINEQAEFEKEALAIYAANPEQGREYLTGYTAKQAGEAWYTAETLFGKLENVKIHSFSNYIQLSSKANIEVAIYSSSGFDATTIDPLTVAFGPAYRAIVSSWAQAQSVSCKDVNNDGLPDCVVSFSASNLAKSVTPCFTELWLSGKTTAGKQFVARDFYEVVE